MTQATGERSVSIGGGVSNSAIVAGDHLERAGAPMADLRRLVETPAWAQAWDALEGGFGGYLSDAQAVWRRAVQEDQQATAQGEPAPWLGLEARCALIEASVHSLAANLPPKLSALLVRHGHWTLRQALVHVRQMPDGERRAAALTQMLPYLPDERLAEALAAARGIENAYNRAEVLTGPAEQMPELWPEVLAAAREADADDRAFVLTALAQCLAALPRAQAYPAWAEALPALARRTREHLLSDLRALAPLIYALGGEQAAGEAFRAVQDVGAWWP